MPFPIVQYKQTRNLKDFLKITKKLAQNLSFTPFSTNAPQRHYCNLEPKYAKQE